MATGRLRGEARAAARVVGDVLLVAVFRMAVIGAFTLRLGRATMPESPSVVVVFFNDHEADLTTADSRGSRQADVRVDARLPITHDERLRGRAERLERVGAAGLADGGSCIVTRPTG